MALIQGSGGASVKERIYGTGGSQGDSGRRHVGSGEHKRAQHGNTKLSSQRCEKKFSQHLQECNGVSFTLGPGRVLRRDYV